MKIKKIIFLFTGLILLSSCKGKSDDASSLTIGVMPDNAAIPFLVGAEKGYFEEFGVNLKVEIFKSASDRDVALQAGTIQGTSSDMISLILLNSSNFKMYSIGQTDARMSMAFSKDSKVDSIDKFSEGSIGLSNSTIMEYLVDKLINEKKLDSSLIKKENIPPVPLRLEALMNNQITSATLPEPLATSKKDSVSSIYSFYDEVTPKETVLLISGEYLDKNKSIAEKIEKGYNKAVEFLNNADYSEYLPSVAEQCSFPEGYENYSFKPFDTFKPTDKNTLVSVNKWLTEKNTLENKVDLNSLINR